jgi:hypothetical protein
LFVYSSSGVLALLHAGADPAPGAAPLSSGLAQLKLRQAEIFFGVCSRKLALAQRALENRGAYVMTAGERPHERG